MNVSRFSRGARRALLAGSLLTGACTSELGRGAQGPGSERKPQLIPVRKVANARVYDRGGAAHACASPQKTCPASQPDREFFDACRLRGYYLRQCGCEQLCTGKITLSAPHYDAQGVEKACADERADCSPPETSARFQDACNDQGHRLVVCGCEWLCSGPPSDPAQP
jgi:hypothetical protein